MAFKPGESGNPSGRPKMPPELIQAFRDRTQDALNTLVEIMNDKEGRGSERVKAAEVIIDRAWGKAIQQAELTGEDGGAIEIIKRVILNGTDAKNT